MSDLSQRERELLTELATLRRRMAREETKEFDSSSGTAATFLGLADTPGSYAGAASTFVRVNSGGSALVFGTVDWGDIYNKVNAGTATRGIAAFSNSNFTVNDGTVSLGTIYPRYSGVPTAGAMAYWTANGTVTADVAYGTATMPRYSGTPAADDMAYWSSAGVLTKAPFGTAHVARLNAANAFVGNQSITSGSVNIGGDALAANTFHIGTTDGTGALARYAASLGGPAVVFKKSRNASVGSHTIVQSGDEMGKFIFQGSDGSAYRSGAQIVAYVDGTPGASDMPGRIELQVTPNGSATPVVGLTLANDKTLTAAGAFTVVGALTFGTAQWTSANHAHVGATSGGLLERYIKTNVLLVDPNFSTTRPSNCYTTIATAMTAAAAGNTILIAPGSYTENVTFTQANITLRGSGTPHFDGTNLVGGTIILGSIDCDGKVGAKVLDLGVDIRAAASDNAIESDVSATGTSAIYQEFRNLTLVGKGSSVSGDRGHGILCQTGGGNIVRNCKFFEWYHGVALRCSDSIVSDCYFKSCLSNSVIIKSDTGSGDAWRNTVTNCIIDGTASGTSYGGPIRIQSIHASYSTRYNTVSNITAKSCSEAAVLIQQTAGTCANVMVSNVVSYNSGDSASRADFDVDTATDIHFTNCMSANRNNGYGFRTTGLRTRAMNCSSDTTGAGRYTGSYDYLDLGSGLGTDLARFRNLTFDANTEASPMRLFNIITGEGTVDNVTTETVLEGVWTGSPNTTMVAINLTFISTSGGHSNIYQRRISLVRPNSTTLEGAMETIGTDLISGAGAQNKLTITLDVATANTFKVRCVATASTVGFSYFAEVLSGNTGAWTIENKAA